MIYQESNIQDENYWVYNAGGQLIEKRDSFGDFRNLISYDVLARPLQSWERVHSSGFIFKTGKYEYGDSTTNTGTNNKGKPIKVYDQAGTVETLDYDFKGNPLSSLRKVVADSDILNVFSSSPPYYTDIYRTDWNDTVNLESDDYQTDMEYDALNRVTQMTMPLDVSSNRNVQKNYYNRAGTLYKTELESLGLVKINFLQMAFNAKGQKLLEVCGNGMMNRYVYDPNNFRLLRTVSEKYNIPSSAPNTYQPFGGVKNDVSYVYDLVGNIVETYDNSAASTAVQGTVVVGIGGLTRYFEYDSLYRLTSATGRETDIQFNPPYWDVRECLEDYSSTRSYTEEYTYNDRGSLLFLDHSAGTDSYSREYIVNSNGSVSQMRLGSGININYDWNERGNMTQEGTERFFTYNNLDQLVAFRNQAGSSEPTVFTHYLYDAGGMRIKKLTRKPGNKSEVAIWAAPGFEHRYVKQTGTGIDATRNYNTESSASATIRIGTDVDDSTPPIKYIISDHLGSASILLTDAGSLINREEYLPYGQTSFGGYLKKKYRYTGKKINAFAQDYKSNPDIAVEKHFNTYMRAELSIILEKSRTKINFLKYNQELDIFPSLTYKTAGDERVRIKHAALNNLTYPINDRFWSYNAAPSDYGCRCYLIQSQVKSKFSPKNVVSTAKPEFVNAKSPKKAELFSQEHRYSRLWEKLPNDSKIEVVKQMHIDSIDVKGLYVETYKNVFRSILTPKIEIKPNEDAAKLFASKYGKTFVLGEFTEIKGAKNPDFFNPQLNQIIDLKTIKVDLTKNEDVYKKIEEKVLDAIKQNAIALIDINKISSPLSDSFLLGLKVPNTKYFLLYKNGVSAVIKSGKLAKREIERLLKTQKP